jgi:hypothetical protein
VVKSSYSCQEVLVQAASAIIAGVRLAQENPSPDPPSVGASNTGSVLFLYWVCPFFILNYSGMSEDFAALPLQMSVIRSSFSNI